MSCLGEWIGWRAEYAECEEFVPTMCSKQLVQMWTSSKGCAAAFSSRKTSSKFSHLHLHTCLVAIFCSTVHQTHSNRTFDTWPFLPSCISWSSVDMDQLRTQCRMKQASVTSCQEICVVKRYQQGAIDRFKLSWECRGNGSHDSG